MQVQKEEILKNISKYFDKQIALTSVLVILTTGGLYLVYRSKMQAKRLPPVYKNSVPIFGMFFEFLKYSSIKKTYLVFGNMNKEEPIVSWSTFGMNGVTTNSAEASKLVLAKHLDYCRNEFAQNVFEDIAKYALFIIPTTNGGQQWKKHRKMLQPAFGPTHLKHGLEVGLEVCKSLSDSWKAMGETGRKNINIHKHFNCLTVDLIGKVAFSYDFNLTTHIRDANNPELYTLYRFENLMSHLSKRFIGRIFWRLRGVHPSQIKQDTDDIKNVIAKVIEQKKSRQSAATSLKEKAGGNFKMDVLDRLMEDGYKNTSKESAFTEEELKDEIFAFFLAGHETTANTMTFVVLELAKHPKILEKVRAEVTEVLKLGNGTLTYENLGHLKYVEAVIKESQRLYPVVPFLSRSSQKDQTLLNYSIPKGSRVMVNIIGLHKNPLYWKNPNEFLPERWIEEGFAPVSGSYIPFGDGPTNCIGQKLAMIEMKTVISMLFYEYEIALVEGQDLEPVSTGTMGLKNGLFCNITPRVH